jgi:hypothetical protein
VITGVRLLCMAALFGHKAEFGIKEIEKNAD